MSFPKIDIDERKIVLLSGCRRQEALDVQVSITDISKLEAAAQRYRDAVAFGYVAGRWVPAA